jgi:hypothetical protein
MDRFSLCMLLLRADAGATREVENDPDLWPRGFTGRD